VIATLTLPPLCGEGCNQHDSCCLRHRRGPGQSRLVASFSRPSGNVTGITNFMNVLEQNGWNW